MAQEQKKIIELLEKEKHGEISYKDLYLELQKYPTEVKYNTIALYLLGELKMTKELTGKIKQDL